MNKEMIHQQTILPNSIIKEKWEKTKKWKDRDKESTVLKAQQSRERNRCTEWRVLLVRVLHLPRLGNQKTKTPCTDAKMSSFVAAPHCYKTSMTNSTYIQYLVSRVFIDNCLQTRAWKNRFLLKQQTHGVRALPLLKASSNQLQLKNIQEQPMKWPGTAEPTYPHHRPVCLHSPQSSVLNKLRNSQVNVVSCLNHAVEESCAPT